MNDVDSIIKAICVSASSLPFEQGDKVDMDEFVKDQPDNQRCVFSMEYQKLRLRDTASGLSKLGRPIEIYVFISGELNEPYKTQKLKVHPCIDLAFKISEQLKKTGTFSNCEIDSVLIKTTSSMVGAKLTGYLEVKSGLKRC